jgi:hypothetical protein
MNKTYLGVGILILVIVGGLCFLVVDEPVVEPVPVEPVETATSTPATATTEAAMSTTSTSTTPDETELDLTKLQGKDRLYTEEEGKYENLSAEEQRLVKKFRCSWYQMKNPTYATNYCGQEITSSAFRIISLKGGVALMYMPGDDGYDYAPSTLYLYDIDSDHFVEYRNSGSRGFGTIAYGPTFMIKDSTGGGYTDEFSDLNPATSSALLLYRPGMKNFTEIPDSRLDANFTYLKWGSDIFRSLPVDFYGDSITVNVYSYDCEGSVVSEYSEAPIECTNVLERTRTFDLSNLP